MCCCGTSCLTTWRSSAFFASDNPATCLFERRIPKSTPSSSSGSRAPEAASAPLRGLGGLLERGLSRRCRGLASSSSDSGPLSPPTQCRPPSTGCSAGGALPAAAAGGAAIPGAAAGGGASSGATSGGIAAAAAGAAGRACEGASAEPEKAFGGGDGGGTMPGGGGISKGKEGEVGHSVAAEAGRRCANAAWA